MTAALRTTYASDSPYIRNVLYLDKLLRCMFSYVNVLRTRPKTSVSTHMPVGHFSNKHYVYESNEEERAELSSQPDNRAEKKYMHIMCSVCVNVQRYT